MNRLKRLTAASIAALMFISCASYHSFRAAQQAEQSKDWDVAVVEYEKALVIDPDNRTYQMALNRARREASRVHFEKGKSLLAAAEKAHGTDQLQLAQLAATELQLTVKLDPTNQFAVVELAKSVELINQIQAAANERVTLEQIKKRAQSDISKAQPPQLNPASNEPISLTFSRDTPVKDIYRALGNAFGINILFDQAVKDDRITIELRDVTAQQALERLMQAANHFYKVLDERSIIVIPDNAQARRDYEDLVIRTFYLSNGDAEQVTNVVRTMIEARNVFPLKALNAITIRDTADKVRIAEKIIEANDKAKAEVVVQVELVQMDLSKFRDLGFAVTGVSQGAVTPLTLDASGNPILTGDGKTVPFTGGTLADIAQSLGDINAIRNGLNFTIPSATYSLLKTLGNSELLANPELRISEGEKATLHIGQQIPVPTTTIAAYTGVPNQQNPNINPYGSTSFNYRDVGIKVSIEPRVHHNREVTLKLTVEVSNRGQDVEFAGQRQPTFATRTIESTIRLMDGETNFLAGLIQSNKVESETKTPILGDIPFIGRLFTNQHREETHTDLVLTMTPHIIRIPDITAEDLAPMWVGTGSNLTFRGMTPRIESQAGNGDPFTPGRSEEMFNNTPVPPPPPEPAQTQPQGYQPGVGTGPRDPFNTRPTQPPPVDNNPPDAAVRPPASSQMAIVEPDTGALRLAPRLAVQPAAIQVGPGESRLWKLVGMDLDGLSTQELRFRFDPRAINVSEVVFGSSMVIDPAAPPAVKIDSANGTLTITATNGRPLQFIGGGEVLAIRVSGGVTGETFLVMEPPDLRDGRGGEVYAAVTGGRAEVN
jgi:general secretion pathway protein D